MSRIALVILIAAWSQSQSGPPAAPQPITERAPDALERVTWRTRTLVGDDRLTQWKFVVQATGAGVPTFLEAVVRADAAVVDFVEGSSTQKVSAQIHKHLDHNLTPGERAAVRAKMGTITKARRKTILLRVFVSSWLSIWDSRLDER